MNPILTKVQFKKGDVLFSEGEESYHFYMIESGEVEILIKDRGPHNSSSLLATLSEGQPVGEFAFIAKNPRTATAIAKSDVEAVLISEEGYQQLLSELPPWASSLMESLVERLVQTDELARLRVRA